VRESPAQSLCFFSTPYTLVDEANSSPLALRPIINVVIDLNIVFAVVEAT
jgi:hypothetical protein